jgi:hypothetical protein
VPATGVRTRLTQMCEWLDQNAGADGWAMTPSGERGVLNDAVSIHLIDASIASAFGTRCCVVHRAVPAGGLFRIREDEPTARVRAPDH